VTPQNSNPKSINKGMISSPKIDNGETDSDDDKVDEVGLDSINNRAKSPSNTSIASSANKETSFSNKPTVTFDDEETKY
jgi:hypothetical protein